MIVTSNGKRGGLLHIYILIYSYSCLVWQLSICSRNHKQQQQQPRLPVRHWEWLQLLQPAATSLPRSLLLSQERLPAVPAPRASSPPLPQLTTRGLRVQCGGSGVEAEAATAVPLPRPPPEIPHVNSGMTETDGSSTAAIAAAVLDTESVRAMRVAWQPGRALFQCPTGPPCHVTRSPLFHLWMVLSRLVLHSSYVHSFVRRFVHQLLAVPQSASSLLYHLFDEETGSLPRQKHQDAGYSLHPFSCFLEGLFELNVVSRRS